MSKGRAVKLPPLDPRIPRWEISRLVERRCPVCSHEGEPCYVRPDSLVIRRCPCCRCYFVSPAPTKEALDEFYLHYSQTHRKTVLRDERLAASLLQMDPLSDLRIRELSSCMRLKGKRVLDVGCGHGRDLINFRKLGAEPVGLDLDEDAIGFAADRLGLTIRKQFLTDLDPDREKFDVIWMGDFIEHPLNPNDVLKHAASMLNPEGVLVIWTPSATFCEQEKEPVLFRVDLEHMQYLSAQTCSYLAGCLGLDVIHLETVGYSSASNWEGQPAFDGGNPLKRLRDLARRMPGYQSLGKLRRALTGLDPRGGTYHLACMLQKPATLISSPPAAGPR